MGPVEHLGTDWAQVSKLTGLPLLMVSPWGAWRPRPHFLLLDFLFPKKHCPSALGDNNSRRAASTAQRSHRFILL